MHYYRATIAYKGTAYFGWQAQSLDTLHEEKPTVEGTLLNALRQICRRQNCTVSAASRTDGGVHAQGQIAKFTLPLEISPERLQQGMNSLLPADIRIIDCQPASKQYQPNRSSISKEYHYYFTAAAIDNVASHDIAQHLPLVVPTAETLQLLHQGCQLFVGQHDFYNFCQRDKNGNSCVRTITYCDIHAADLGPLTDNVYYLKIIGNGFLKFMIRYVMGALVELACGRISLDDIQRYIDQHQSDKLSAKVKPRGLHLMRIDEQ
ncbi:tRNA pseudouridine synthase A [Sinobacterium norvegicum]|uniref:tRNA pseudouridine synthase A n=1 Tax=Sinobacterium norvegicum TaxID=1641715 RepID=A0ABM9ADM1_9GAMM|nr:tRNA pseudouridine(38-40) synthase TruA [Sinobacterium norvegicum]CAH0991312.1 tRNA pseudouridine synthase A [Sinobacterium norvegicum]